MHDLFTFPGEPFLAQILKTVLQTGLVTALYVLCLRILQYYIPGVSPGNKALKMVFGGGLLGIGFAKYYALIFERIFSADPMHVSIALIVGILVNLEIAHRMYSTKDHKETD